MVYTRTITTAAGVAEDNPDQAVLKVTSGLVYRIEVDFPPGCAGLHHCVITDGGYQVWPSTPGDTFHADAQVIAFDDTYLKTIQPFQFDVWTYNLDDTYGHGVQVRIGQVSNEVFMARFLPTYTYKYFLEMISKLQADQEQAKQAATIKPFAWLKES